ncbi:MAG: hypothetical protein EAZ95_10970 [Bacteroidetes bacterium]|nr:MAG: hypothetical protein EAZ95_10970 [Bacteroidota bacterium]
MLFNEKSAQGYFHTLFAQNKSNTLDAYYHLNKAEQRKIKKIRQRGLWYSALFGALGVILLYLPIHIYPKLFPTFSLELPWAGKTVIPWAYFLYMVFLALAEIYALTWLNLMIVYAIARVCRFPDKKDEHYDAHIRMLFEASLDKTNKLQKQFGINPLAGLSPVRLFVVSTLFILKATLSNLLVKFLLKRTLARFALVGYAYYVDYFSVFIFAGWNMYATHVVVREAKVRVMGPSLIQQLVQHLHKILKDDVVFKEVLLDVLQVIAVAKRNYHHNHYLLAHELVKVFELPKLEEIAVNEEQLLEKMGTMSDEAQQGIAKLFILGLLVDGSISMREISFATNFRERGIWSITTAQLRQWEHDYTTGKGLDSLFYEPLVLR